MRAKKFQLFCLFLLFSPVFLTPTVQETTALNGKTYSVPFSNKAPLLDASFDDPEWALAINTTYQINNPLGYVLSGYVADLSVALLGTPSGLYMALTLTMVQLDSSGMGFNNPGFYVQFDTDNNGYINNTDTASTPDDDILIYATNNKISAGQANSVWSNRYFDYSMIGELSGANLTRTLRAEIRYSYLQSGTVQQSFGVNFGVYHHKYKGYSSEVYTNMVDSGDKVQNWIRNPNYYNINSFSNLVLQPGVAVDMYPPTINLLTPISGIDGVYNLSVSVTDVNDIIAVEFSEDRATWILVNQVPSDPVKYTHMWDSSGFNGSSLYFRAMDNQSNIAILTIDTTASTPSGDYKFVAVVVDNSPPLLNIISPTLGSTISGTVTIQVQAIDSSTVVMVDWKVGDSSWANMYNNPLSGYWEATWNTTALVDGNYTLSFKARDTVNNIVTISTEMRVVTTDPSVITTETTTETEQNTVTETVTDISETTVTEIQTVTVTGNSTVNETSSDTNTATDINPLPFPIAGFVAVFFFVALMHSRRRNK